MRPLEGRDGALLRSADRGGKRDGLVAVEQRDRQIPLVVIDDGQVFDADGDLAHQAVGSRELEQTAIHAERVLQRRLASGVNARLNRQELGQNVRRLFVCSAQEFASERYEMLAALEGADVILQRCGCGERLSEDEFCASEIASEQRFGDGNEPRERRLRLIRLSARPRELRVDDFTLACEYARVLRFDVLPEL